MGRRALPRATGLRFAAAWLVLVCAARVAGQNELEPEGSGSGVDEGGLLARLDLNSSSAVSQYCLAADATCRCVGRQIEVEGLGSNVLCSCGPDCHTCPFDGNRPVGNECELVCDHHELHACLPPGTPLTCTVIKRHSITMVILETWLYCDTAHPPWRRIQLASSLRRSSLRRPIDLLARRRSSHCHPAGDLL